MRSQSVFVGLVFLALAVAAVADDSGSSEKASGTWVGGTSPQLRVKVDSSKKHVEVTVSKTQGQVPRSIGISFFDGQGSRTTLELKSVEPVLSMPTDVTQYHGALAPTAEPFVGFEIKIPLGGEAPTIVTSDDLKKVE